VKVPFFALIILSVFALSLSAHAQVISDSVAVVVSQDSPVAEPIANIYAVNPDLANSLAAQYVNATTNGACCDPNGGMCGAHSCTGGGSPRSGFWDLLKKIADLGLCITSPDPDTFCG